MCNPTDVEEPAKGKTEAETETEAFNTEKSARRKPQNGKDLGVWEISLEDRSNMLSLWTLGYLSPLLRLGAFKLLEQDDVGVPSKVDLADTAYDVILRAWAEQVEKCAAFNTEKTKLYDASVARCNNDEQRTKVKKTDAERTKYGYCASQGIRDLEDCLCHCTLCCLGPTWLCASSHFERSRQIL